MKRFFPLAALAAASLGLAACKPAQPAADPEFGAKVRAYLLENPEVIQEAVTQLRLKEAAKAAAPTLARYRKQLENDPRDLVINPRGSVTVVEFFDYRCGYCKVVAPEVAKLIRENPDVRFVFKEFPIFGEVSQSAARVALTPQAKAKGLPLHQALMADKSLSEASLDQHLRDAGLDPATVRQAARDPAIDQQLQDVRALAGGLGLTGTPAFIIGDYVIPGADMDSVRAALARIRNEGMKRPPAAAPT
ncbi:MAG: DsbA family protein [Phenylobacterium sp.]|uniref:DsbA family protein n=1 Tax=Phenylobacterium sp. TaxID=1871053 RepID=UPI001A623F7C|nr:DsbA family protein [Phenylobacterium sp.]MBL8771270.1 DsbA family protein [Phenylobacterium sp.]